MKLKHLFIAMLVFSLLWVSGCSNEIVNEVKGKENEFPPSMTGFIHTNGTKYEIVSGGYKWERKQGLNTQIVQTDAASPNQIAEKIKPIALEPNQKINIEIEENPQLSVYLWNQNGIEKEMNLHANQITVPSSKGKYIYEVLAKLSNQEVNGEVSYTFVVEIQ